MCLSWVLQKCQPFLWSEQFCSVLLDVWALLQILGGRQCASDFAWGGLWPWRWRKNCGPGRKTWWDLCCLLTRLGLRGGVHTVQDEENEASLLSFTKSILSTIPFSLQQCNIKESHWHQLDFDQWMIAKQRMPRSRLGFHKFTTKKP